MPRKTAEGSWQPARALDAMRWLDRLGYHTWRACNDLAGTAGPTWVGACLRFVGCPFVMAPHRLPA